MADANLKVLNADGTAKYLKESGAGSDGDPHVAHVNNAMLGAATSDAAVSTDATGTIHQYLRGLVKLIVAKINIATIDTLTTITNAVGITNALLGGATSDAAVSTDATGSIHQYLRGLVKLIAAKINIATVDTVTAVTTITNAVTVNAHAVTNAGTFVTQENGSALTALQLIDNIVSGAGANISQINGVTPLMGAGATGTGSPRVTAATDSPEVTSLAIIDDWDESDRAKVNIIAGQVGVAAGAGAVSALTQRVTLASDDPAVAALSRAVLEGGLTELVGINEQVDQNDYSGSINVALGGTYSGEILSVALYATEDGTGAVQDSAGILYIFDADPTISSGDTSMSAAERVTVLGKVVVAASDWDVDANGGIAFLAVSIPFHALATLYFAWKQTDATALNDAAGDDEQLEFNFWYRRDS